MNEEDDRALRYLENLTVDEYEDVKSGFKIGMVRLFVCLSPSHSLSLSLSLSPSQNLKCVGTLNKMIVGYIYCVLLDSQFDKYLCMSVRLSVTLFYSTSHQTLTLPTQYSQKSSSLTQVARTQ